MENLYRRLDRCFASVFPDLDPGAIRAANTDDTPTWDSSAMLTLIAVVEEEFGTRFKDEVLVNLVSYQAFVTHLELWPSFALQSDTAAP